jgi:hypothetical protein
MKTFLSGFIMMILVVVFSSCQKEVDEVLINGVQNDSTEIQQLVVLDTNYASGIDTVIKWELTYNASKKLSGIYYTGYRNVSGPNRIFLYEEYKYLYQGSNPYPEKIIVNYTDPSNAANNFSDTTFFTYSNGIIIRDSTGDVNNYIVTEFTQLASNRYKMLQKTPSFFTGGVYIDTTYILVDWQNGNLKKEIDSLWIPSLGFWEVKTTTIDYDSKPNPFKKIALPYPTPANRDLPSFGIEALFMPTTNNMVRQVYSSGTYTMTYEYGANGLPKIARDEDGLKVFYRYTRL